MTGIVLVRHAETVWHAENRYTGKSDVALTELGYRQAERLGEWARTAGLAAIWTSPLTRCRLTAAPAVEATGLAPIVDARLRELDFGRLDGKTKAEAMAAFPDAMHAYLADPVTNHMEDGEPPRAAAERALPCFAESAAAHPDGRVLIVAHSTLIRLLLCRLLGLELSRYRAFFPILNNCAVTELSFQPDSVGLVALNVPT